MDDTGMIPLLYVVVLQFGVMLFYSVPSRL